MVLGRLAGNLGGGQRVRKPVLALAQAGNAEAGRDVHLLALTRKAKLLERAPQVVGNAVGRVHRRLGHEDREAVAGDPRCEHAWRKALPDDLGDAHDHRIADVHAEVLVQQVQAVDVDIDDAVFLAQDFGRQGGLYALLERGPREQARRRIVGVEQDVGDASPEQLDDAHLAQVEVRGAQFLEEHEHAVHALRPVHDRAGEDLVWNVRERPRHVRGVRGHRLPVQLTPAEQLAMGARENLGAGARRRVQRGTAHGDVLVGNQQRADGAVEMVDAALDQLREIVGRVAALRLLLRRAKQQLEVAVADDEAALQVADARLRSEFALQAMQGRTQQSVHERERSRLTVRFAAHHGHAAEHCPGLVAQHEEIGDLLAGQRFRQTRADCAGRGEFCGLCTL